LMKVISIWQRERENGRQMDCEPSSLLITRSVADDGRPSIAA
jgi:hypothetical protein